ncbi:gamma-glutamyl-gamma-aminobutyrate hydrolase family protein [Pseudomonas sp. YeP6b]|uniref:gamma-glutamyl-gamma-aminobutyrate hydrolase family protein n=1 Tax=Pseudomonas sp. YeP6b TaxID=2861775 RepID=UPI0021D7F8E1|nr:gamma-glutamyl-gamma-aminobutyrate hydrolase family protein [Pseudomonas sp. YeP6b]UXZ21263.1 gamma-glutamyl-gamma-aminobutyrate hydrolase family protein [Pseudomonas sp. YeP6b]
MRIAITQRVEWVQSYNERRDCLDQQWSALLEILGIDAVAVPNKLKDPAAWLARQNVGGLLLTGGNDLAHLVDALRSAPERDATELALLSWAASNQIPVLGVCRGMQMLNHFLGGALMPVANHSAVKHSVSALNDDPLFSSYREVNSYHRWGIGASDLALGLCAQVRAGDDTVEAFTHNQLPWVGVMWHPEREVPFSSLDIQLIRKLFESRNT